MMYYFHHCKVSVACKIKQHIFGSCLLFSKGKQLLVLLYLLMSTSFDSVKFLVFIGPISSCPKVVTVMKISLC